jgi:hypothetical protein
MKKGRGFRRHVSGAGVPLANRSLFAGEDFREREGFPEIRINRTKRGYR